MFSYFFATKASCNDSTRFCKLLFVPEFSVTSESSSIGKVSLSIEFSEGIKSELPLELLAEPESLIIGDY